MRKTSVVNLLLYGGIDRTDFESIRSRIWHRNLSSLRITASLAAGLGTVFLVINYLRHAGNQLPYLFLLIGGLFTWLHLLFARKKVEKREIRGVLLCYGLMILLFGYSVFLSVQPSNYDIPATSAIVFLTIIPLSIDDRPLRMFAVMLAESVAYLLLSSGLKSPNAFSLDLMNVATFCFVGMILYAVICARNIREIYQSQRIEQMSFQTIQTLANAIDAKDPYTKGHSTRVSQYAVMIAGELGWDKNRIETLRYAALLHDIGKIGVPDSILNKPGRLTDVEFGIIRSHTTMGGEILRERKIVDVAEEVALCHHERYDGTGYPHGLRGNEISDEARIVGIADAFDAMNSNRIYRKACDSNYIRQQLIDGRGKQFDPEYVDILIRLWDDGRLEESLKDAAEASEETQSLTVSLHEALDAFVSESAEPASPMDGIRDSRSYDGALNVGYDQFSKLYEFVVNLEKRFGHPFKLILITLDKNTGEDSPAAELEKAMSFMDHAIRISIRGVDIMTQYNRQQFLVLFIGTDFSGVEKAADRIFKSYFRMSGSNAFSPSYTVVETKPENQPSRER